MSPFPWLTLTLALPLLGWIWLSVVRSPSSSRYAQFFAISTCLTTVLFSLFFFERGGVAYLDPWIPWLGVNIHNVVLLPFASGIAVSILILSPKSALNRAGMAHVLFMLAATLTFFCSHNIWLFAAAWLVSGWPVYAPVFHRHRKEPLPRGAVLFLLSCLSFLGLFALLSFGFHLSFSFSQEAHLPESMKLWFIPVFLLAVAARMGLFPFHAWVFSSLGEGRSAAFLMVLCPITGAYALLRLRLWSGAYFSHSAFAWLGLLSALYFILVALAQKEQFRAVLYLVLGQIGLVFMGLVSAHQQSTTGALVLWLSLGVSGSGILLMSWSLRARRGDIRLDRFHGFVRSSPFLAATFFLFGMGLIGLPGTLTFIAEDLICQGILVHETALAVLYILVTALGAITFLRLFALIFLGETDTVPCPDLSLHKRMISLLMALALFVPGILPYPVVTIPGDFVPRPAITHSSK